jgi:hypothetical protein
VYSTGRAQVKIERGVYEPRVHADVLDDVVAVVAGATNLGEGGLSVGASLKTIWRRRFDRVLTAREITDFAAADLLDQLEDADLGVSMDLGALWSSSHARIRAAAVLRDAAGRIAGEGVGVALDAGVAWSLGPRLVVAADLRDLFEPDLAFGTKTRLGAEVRLGSASVRAGVHQGYAAFGASFALPLLSMDYAFYGRELGDVPGAEGQYQHAVEARIGF